MIDGQQVEVMQGMGSEDEEEIDMMAVEGSDGQQYVVLEVIQLGDGEEQAMVVGEGAGELLSESILPDHGKFRVYLSRAWATKQLKIIVIIFNPGLLALFKSLLSLVISQFYVFILQRKILQLSMNQFIKK